MTFPEAGLPSYPNFHPWRTISKNLWNWLPDRKQTRQKILTFVPLYSRHCLVISPYRTCRLWYKLLCAGDKRRKCAGSRRQRTGWFPPNAALNAIVLSLAWDAAASRSASSCVCSSAEGHLYTVLHQLTLAPHRLRRHRNNRWLHFFRALWLFYLYFTLVHFIHFHAPVAFSFCLCSVTSLASLSFLFASLILRQQFVS